MTPTRWRQIDQLLETALELPAGERAAFLAKSCNGDATLRREVEQLLAAGEGSEDFLEAAPAEAMAEVLDAKLASSLVGSRVGPYQILRELGRGGMGIVCLAERTDQQYRQQVAIKLLWPGVNQAEIVRRFRRERQILANLHHPNIAQLFDGGTTEDGRPYFVMEHVTGQPITEYCRARQLAVTERLTLFQQVCSAVQYAHQNLVIHRDLKPGNILVTEDGTVKLLDFGIAKLLDAERHGLTAQPTTNALMMTPEYASPEQMRGHPVTTASDVYSLGVVLYELLTGQSPYEFKDRSLPELIRVVCEQEPIPPSRRANSASLRGDIDGILLTALQKEPERRYQSVQQFRDDIRRHLDGQPIQAQAIPLRYLAGKFVRRNKLAVAAAAMILLTLLGGIVATIWQARIAREQARANRRLAYAGQMALATQAWEMANVARMRELVENYLPRDGEEDLRGFEWYHLWRLYHRTGELLNLRHPDEVWSVAFAPDGKRFATGCDDGKARLWDAATGAQLAEFNGHKQFIWSTAFSPDGRLLATGSGDKTAKLWEAATGRELFTLTGHSNRVGAVAFSPDGKRLATCGRDDTVKLWDVTTGQELMSIWGGEQSVYTTALAFSPDGKKLAAGGSSLKLYDATTGRELLKISQGYGTFAAVFSPDGKTLATASGGGHVKLWSAVTGNQLAELKGHTGQGRSIAFSPDGKTLATASSERTVKLWDVATGKEQAVLKGHSSEIYSLAFSPDGKKLVTASADMTARLWDVAVASEPSVLNIGSGVGIRAAVFADGKKLLINVNLDHVVTLLDAVTLQTLLEFREFKTSPIPVAVSPDGARLMIASIEKPPTILDALTGQELVTMQGHTNIVGVAAFSPDGRQLATGSYDKTIRLWDVATGRELMTLRGHALQCDTVAFAPNGKLLATGSYDNTAKLWDLVTGRELATLKGHTNPILGVAFSPDGLTLATGSADGLVRLWQTYTGREIITIKGHAGHVKTLAFSPDGKRLATGGSEGLVRLWDIANGQELIALRGHTGMVNTVGFSADGALLVSSGSDGFVRLWRAATSQEAAVEVK